MTTLTTRTTVRVALITGGGSGIGLATARHLLDDGWAVAITGRTPETLASGAADLPHPERVLMLPGDTGHAADVQGWVEAVLDRFGAVDAVVANAGFATTGWLEHDNPDGWRQMVLTNVLGPALLIHYAREALIRARGRILLVGSVAGLVPTEGNLYGASKYAITGLAENARRAFTEHHVGVTLVAPGRVDSPFWDDVGGRPDSLMLDAADLGRTIGWVLGQPGDVDINTLVVRPFESAI